MKQNIGHFWRHGNANILECLYVCGGQSRLIDPVRLLRNVTVKLAVNLFIYLLIY